jgi:SAM-dependent methyltransferase
MALDGNPVRLVAQKSSESVGRLSSPEEVPGWRLGASAPKRYGWPVDQRHRESAQHVRALLEGGAHDPALFRAALASVPREARDGWVDLALGLGAPPEDGPELPRGCVPYLPCAVDALLRLVEHAPVRAADVFIDIGSGLGRAAVLVHLLTGARAVGLEVQPALVAGSRELTGRLRLSGVSFVEGDAATLAGALAEGSVFLLYCPFSGDRLARVLSDLEPVARTRAIRVCCVDLRLPPRRWLALASPPWLDLAIHRSVGSPQDGGSAS